MSTNTNMLDIPAAGAALNDNGLRPLPEATAPQSPTEDALAKALKEIESLKNQVNNQQSGGSEIPEVEKYEYKGNAMVKLTDGRSKGVSIQFGGAKARLIVKHFEAVKALASKKAVKKS